METALEILWGIFWVLFAFVSIIGAIWIVLKMLQHVHRNSITDERARILSRMAIIDRFLAGDRVVVEIVRYIMKIVNDDPVKDIQRFREDLRKLPSRRNNEG